MEWSPGRYWASFTIESWRPKNGANPARIGALYFCLVGLVYTATAPDESVKVMFTFIFLIYAVAAVLAVLNLNVLKRFALVCSFLWAVTWVVLSLGVFDFDSSLVPIPFLRAISIEAAFIMASLFIAASYLGWIEDGRHA